MKQIKVLQLIDSLHIGGAEVLAVNINNLLNDSKEIKSFLCATREEGDLKKRIHNLNSYLFLNKKNVFDLFAILRLRKFIKKNGVSIIHAHSSSYFLAVCLKCILPRIKIIWHDHYGLSEFVEKRKRQPLRFFSGFFSYGIFVNDKLLNWSKQNLKIKNVNILRNFAFFNNNSKITFLKNENEKRIVCVGAFRPQKDHLNLLKAFTILHEKHPNWTLHLIGKRSESDYFREIQSFILNNNLENSVFIYGACEDLKFILSQAEIGVLPSKSEGLPISLLEYGLAKLPVVVTNVGDCGMVLVNNGGILVEKENSKDLADAIIELINFKEKRIKFGLNLYNTVIQGYSETEFLRNLTHIYKGLS